MRQTVRMVYMHEGGKCVYPVHSSAAHQSCDNTAQYFGFVCAHSLCCSWYYAYCALPEDIVLTVSTQWFWCQNSSLSNKSVDCRLIWGCPDLSLCLLTIDSGHSLRDVRAFAA